MRRVLIITTIAFVLLGALISYVIVNLMFEDIRASAVTLEAAENHLKSNSDVLFKDTTHIISTCSKSLGDRIAPKDLPMSLRAEGIDYAVAHENYLALVFWQSPDTIRGYRIWIRPANTDYVDKLTSIPDVYRFRYCDDYPDSPSNHNE